MHPLIGHCGGLRYPSQSFLYFWVRESFERLLVRTTLTITFPMVGFRIGIRPQISLPSLHFYCMTTKYQLEETRSQILLDLIQAYPTKLSEYENSSCRGEAVFGFPPTQSILVLDLLVQCKVAFALPFAYYSVCVAGDLASLDTSTDGVVLSPEILKTALRGQVRLKGGESQFAKQLAFRECTAWKCSGKLGKGRAEVYGWIVPDVALTNGILERGEFPGSGFCHQCMQAFSQELKKAKEEAWKNLPLHFGLPPWDDAVYQFGSQPFCQKDHPGPCTIQ
jgi:hypothetical protein